MHQGYLEGYLDVALAFVCVYFMGSVDPLQQ